MPAEELRLVESFDELRVGMLVVVKDCRLCGAASHRQMLRAMVPCRKDGVVGVGWAHFGRPCADVSPLEPSVSRFAVVEGRVYRVIDPAEQHETKHARKKENVDAR